MKSKKKEKEEEIKMKQLKINVVESSVEDKLRAYAIAKKADTIKASDYLETPFKVKDYVITENVLTDDETGEVSQPMICITILTVDGETIGTNSKPLINCFKELMDIAKDIGTDFSTLELIITQQNGKNGRFNSISFVL